MLITVAVLVYKNISYLRRTVESIVNQKDVEVELIISDDCSDNLLVSDIEAKIQDICDRESIKKLVIRRNNKNLGIVAHANKVFSMATGVIIAPLTCGDAFYHEYVLFNIFQYFQDNRCLIATGMRACFSEETGDVTEILPTENQVRVLRIGGRKLVNQLCRGNFISGASTYYSAKLFEKYGGFDEHMFLIDDYPKYLRLLFAGEKIYFIDEITIKYQLGGVSTGEKNLIFDKDMQMIYDLVIVPHKNDIGLGTYRYLKCRNYKNKHSKLFGALYCLLYPDVIFMKAFFKIRSFWEKRYHDKRG